MPSRQLSILALIFGMIACLCLPARVEAFSNPIRFDQLTVENGLSQNSIWAITQDVFGFIWFGSDEGLNQYDGYAVKVYRHDPDDTNSLSHNAVTALYSDHRGNLWIGTLKGLDRYNPVEGRFDHFPFVPKSDPQGLWGSTIQAITEGPEGDLWIATEYGGLNRLDPGTGKVDHWLPQENNPNSISSENVYDLLFNKDTLWLATSRGLNRYELNGGVFTHFLHARSNPTSLSSSRCTSLWLDSDGFLWVGTNDGGLNRMRTSTGRFDRFMPDPEQANTIASNQVNDLIEDDLGNLWIATRQGISILNRTSGQFTTLRQDRNDPASLSNNTVTSLFRDRSNVLWAGTYGGGVNRYARFANKFNLYTQKSGSFTSLSDSGVYAMAESRYGSLWIGTVAGGLNRFDRGSDRMRYYLHKSNDPTSLASNEIRALLVDRLNNLWIGTYNAGLDRFDPLSNKFIHYTLDPERPEILSQHAISVIFEDRNGNLWVGTQGYGFHRLDRLKDRFEHFSMPVEDEGAWEITTIYEDSQGFLWLGTQLGVFVFNPRGQIFTAHYDYDPARPDSLSASQVTGIYQDATGMIWITTLRGGLNRLDPQSGTVRVFEEKDGLASNTLYSILPDDNGGLWVSSNRGISRFDPASETFRNYDTSDGLMGNEFYPGSSYRSHNGELFFGGVNGMVSFYPEEILDNPIPPLVVVRKFQRYNQVEAENLVGGEPIELSHRDNFISFEFAALDFNAPEKNQFAYMLEGFDKDWIYTGTRNFASYTNLTGGNYLLRVKAANNDGVWNEAGISVPITVHPPFYTTWWFVVIVTVGLAAAVYGGYQIRLRTIQAQNRFLEQLVSQRTQEIESRRHVAEGLREIITILNSNHTLRDSLDYIIRQALQLLNASRAFIFCCQDQKYQTILAGNIQGTSSLEVWLDDLARRKQPVLIEDLSAYQQQHPELDFSDIASQGALAFLPVSTGAQKDGGLVIIFSQSGPIADEDFKTALTLADQASLAIGNANLRSQAEELAKSTERSRLARDLHDAVTQTLFASTLIADVLPRIWQRNPEEGQRRLEELRQLTRGALAEMRTLLIELRPGALVDAPLYELIQQLSDAFTGRTRIKVACAIEEIGAQPAEVQVAVYRIAQETLNNISKHAHASQVQVRLRRLGGQYELSISDNGQGFEHDSLHSTHFGLGIMRERAQSIGATFEVLSVPGRGTTIKLRWRAE